MPLLWSWIQRWQLPPNCEQAHCREPKQLSSSSSVQFSLIQSLSHVQLFVTPWTVACSPPCLSPTSRVYSNSCPLSWWCHPTILSSVIPFSSCLQSFPASGFFFFPRSQFFASGGQSIGVWTSASVLPMDIQDWSPLGWTGWISLQSKGLSRIFSGWEIKIKETGRIDQKIASLGLFKAE